MDWIYYVWGPVELGQFVPRWVSVLADATLKSLTILAIAGVVTVAMRSASAAARHGVWAMALGSILVLPLLSTLLPSWELGIIPALEVERHSATVQGSGATTPAVALAPAPLDRGPASVERVPLESAGRGIGLPVAPPKPGAQPLPLVESRSSVGVLVIPIFVVWGMGAALVLGMLVTGLVRASLMTKKASPVLESEWVRLSERLCKRLGIRRPVVLLRDQTAATPATWGVMRPIVLLPAASDNWSSERRRDVLVHELAHVKRYDFLTQIIGRYACAMFWFNPLMWLAARQMRIERERACDDEVLRAGTKASTYAGHLLEIARSVKGFSATSFSSVAMAQRSQLSERLLAILEDGRNRGPMSRSGAAIAWITALVFFIPVASVTTVRAQTPGVWAAPEVVIDPAVASAFTNPLQAVRVPPSQERQALQWASAPECHEADRDGESRGINENENNDRRTSRWWDEDCEGEVRVRGEIRFTPDYTDIQSVSRNGRFSIEIDVNGDSRRVEVRPIGSVLQRRWFVNGSEVAYGPDAETWFPRALQDFFRHSSYDLDGRVDFILANDGVPGLLAQAEESHGQYLTRRFYVAAIETGELDPGQIEQILQRAMRDLTSDFEMARLLRTIPPNDLQDANLRRTYVRASDTIESDFEKSRILKALLQQEGLQTDVVRMLLESARDIESDFELARLLTTIGPQYLDEPTARDLYLEATRSIASDFELQRVLASLLETENLSRENIRLLLGSATQIESDFESARLLMRVADKFVVDESLRQLFFQSVEEIESDFERQRVLTALVRQDGLSNDVVSDAIRSAITIDGDFAKANVLRAIANKYSGDGALRSQLEDAAETLSSDHEYGRVMSAIRGRSSI